MESFLQVAKGLLDYGFPGLTVILVYLVYRLLKKEQERDPPRLTMYPGIYVYMALSLVFAILALIPGEKWAELVVNWASPDHEKLCAKHLKASRCLEQQLKALEAVQFSCQIVGIADPSWVNIAATREWRIDPPDSSGQLRGRRINMADSAIILKFWSRGPQGNGPVYGQVKELSINDFRDGSYSLGQITLRKNYNPWKRAAPGSGFSGDNLACSLRPAMPQYIDEPQSLDSEPRVGDKP
jgi:hypothetical protein